MFLVLASLCASCHLTRRRGGAEVFFPVFFSLRIPRVSACPLSPHAEARRRGGVFSGFLFPSHSLCLCLSFVTSRGDAEVFSSHPSVFPMSLPVPCDLTPRRGDVFGPGVPVCLVSSHAETRRRGEVLHVPYPFAFPVSLHALCERTRRREGTEMLNVVPASAFSAPSRAPDDLMRRRGDVQSVPASARSAAPCGRIICSSN